MRSKEILIFTYDGAQPIDIAGPLQALATANEEAGHDAYRVRVAAIRGGALSLAGGLRVLVERLPRRRVHTLIVPGGPGVFAARRDLSHIVAVRRLAQRAQRVARFVQAAFCSQRRGC